MFYKSRIYMRAQLHRIPCGDARVNAACIARRLAACCGDNDATCRVPCERSLTQFSVWQFPCSSYRRNCIGPTSLVNLNF